MIIYGNKMSSCSKKGCSTCAVKSCDPIIGHDSSKLGPIQYRGGCCDEGILVIKNKDDTSTTTIGDCFEVRHVTPPDTNKPSGLYTFRHIRGVEGGVWALTKRTIVLANKYTQFANEQVNILLPVFDGYDEVDINYSTLEEIIPPTFSTIDISTVIALNDNSSVYDGSPDTVSDYARFTVLKVDGERICIDLYINYLVVTP